MGINVSKSTISHPQVRSNWVATDMSQKGEIVIVTGANSGIGYEMALELARKGAHVILACRNEERGLNAQADIQEVLATTPDPGSVKYTRSTGSAINNAGIGGSTYTKTVDGYELIFATNYLGHFALTAQLFETLKNSAPSRIVSVSSFLHWYGTWVCDENNIMANSSKEHGQIGTYSISKLCLLLFMTELDRRLKTTGIENVTAAAAYPGYSLLKGALPALYASTADGVKGGDYYGPKYLEVYGHPVREEPAKLMKSETAAAKLWAYSEKLTHLKFDVTK
ncbi:hypothetical protein PPTG_11121 [Phytophthora nicotianae INRA-310]|uniref:Uncharacterized protein n=1 Tax=Phytophthora nicotianae (strain INRA-310) TaxID=761204 RepID=W2Q9W8_PHYN3|nr:hypothetical protein PPTG_11121 [Phytophthora nicotianae INRA-310]ETN09070.1 hypothetical protein PPTG_11121 [Phytophthora nicotianae INRA-310]